MSEKINMNTDSSKNKNIETAKKVLKGAGITGMAILGGKLAADRELPRQTEEAPRDSGTCFISKNSGYQDSHNNPNNETTVEIGGYDFGEPTLYTVQEGDNGIWGIVKDTYNLTDNKLIQIIANHIENDPENAELLENNKNVLFPGNILSIPGIVDKVDNEITFDEPSHPSKESTTSLEDSDDVKTPDWVKESVDNLRSGDTDTNPDI